MDCACPIFFAFGQLLDQFSCCSYSPVNVKIMQQMINVTYLLLSQQSSHPHWSIELILDDPQIPSVLDLRLDDLRDDFFPLGSALGARQTNGSLWIEDPITENLNREI